MLSIYCLNFIAFRQSIYLMAISYVVLVVGFAFYAFAINTLIGTIRQENFSKSFLRVIDTDSDGIITKKEMTAFQPCDEYDGKKIKRQFGEYGRRADLNDLALDLDEKMIIKAVKKCVGDVAAFTNPDHLKHLKKSLVKDQMLGVYDLNDDGTITWGEYTVADYTISEHLPYARIVFRFFDKNHDWKITTKELSKAKPADLAAYIGSGGKRRKKR